MAQPTADIIRQCASVREELGEIQTARGEMPQPAALAPSPDVHQAWQELRSAVEAVPPAWQQAAWDMEMPTADIIGQGESVCLKLSEIQTAREEALPPSIETELVLENETHIFESLYGIQGLLAGIGSTHTIRLDIQASGVPAGPAQPTPSYPPMPEGTRQMQTGASVGAGGGRVNNYVLNVTTSRPLSSVTQEWAVQQALGGG